jgi:hypothetical protein
MSSACRRLLITVSVLAHLAVLAKVAGADEREDFEKYMEYNRAIVAKQHLIALVEAEPMTGKGAEASFRYDHYPELERIQSKDGTFARKKGKAWLKSNDWAETGTPVKKAKAEELSAWASYAMVPVVGKFVSKDAAQGGLVITLTKAEPKEGGGERLFYEIRREHSTGFLYPQFVFDQHEKGENAMLVGYAGLLTYGEEKIRVNINYSYLFQVKMTVVNGDEEKKAAGEPKKTPLKKKK